MGPTQEEPHKTGPTSNYSLLIVEDDAVNALVLQRLLGRYFHTQHIFNGTKALELLEVLSFDCILMDINLGDDHLNGMEVMHHLRAMPERRLTPIIAISGYVANNEQQTLLEAGFNRFFSKPLAYEELSKTIFDLIEA